MTKIPLGFYQRGNVQEIAEDLLGCFLCTNMGGRICKGKIVETEAYAGVVDKASHAYGGRRTDRTQVMYASGGVAYVYLCYGIHHLFNVVTNKAGHPHAVLIRALEPYEGIEEMAYRRDLTTIDFRLTNGPGVLTQAMGITFKDTGISLKGDKIWLESRIDPVKNNNIISGRRIGIDYADEDALKPWRYALKNNEWVSHYKNFVKA